MHFRKTAYNSRGGIDMEVNHPKFGWIPFTASPDDPEKHGRDLFDASVSKGGVLPYVEPSPKSQTEIDAEIDAETNAENSKGARADRQLLFRLMKSASPDPANYTKADFRQARRKLIANMTNTGE